MTTIGHAALTCGIAILSFCASPGAAQVVPEWTLDSSNWQKAEGLLPEPVLRRLKAGDYSYRVADVAGEKFRALYPEAFWAKSRSNQGIYRIDPKTCGLRDAADAMPASLDGFPFPSVSADAADAACSIMWNVRAADVLGGGRGSTFTINGIDIDGEHKRLKLSREEGEFLSHLVHNRSDATEILRRASMTRLLEPPDVDGASGLEKRFNDASPDKRWIFVTSTRRIRREEPSSRSTPIAELPFYPEDFGGFDSKIEYFSWRLVGAEEVLASVVTPTLLTMKRLTDTRYEIDLPKLPGAYETPGASGVPWQVVENVRMVRRPVWIVEGRSLDPHHEFGKVVLYIDREMYRIYWKLVYDRAGEYFYNAMFNHYWARSEDGSVAATGLGFVLGVNDVANRAAISGRPTTSVIESSFPDDHFQLPGPIYGCFPD